MFIRYNEFWGGEPSQDDLDKIYTRKPRAPFREVVHDDGTKQKVWCTFDEEQIDIDVFSDLGKRFIDDQLKALTDKCALSFHCRRLCSLAIRSLKLSALGVPSTGLRRGIGAACVREGHAFQATRLQLCHCSIVEM